MEIYTLDTAFKKLDIVEGFESAIWTERYYGDSEVEIIVPLKSKLIQKLSPGTFVSLTGSSEVMVVETHEVDASVKCTGISLLAWLNNRFIRVSDTHADRTWYLDPMKPGEVLWTMIQAMCMEGSPYLDGSISIGIPAEYTQRLIIHELGLHDYDISGDDVQLSIPYGPLYDAMREVAVTFQLGIQIIKEVDPGAEHILGFRAYRGQNRTYTQSENPIVRFSPFFDSLINIKEVDSIAALKTVAFAFASGADDALSGVGIVSLQDAEYQGFQLRALQVFVDDISVDVPDDQIIVVLNDRARAALRENSYIQAVDGEIVSTNMFKYGVDYNLGDIVEIQGNSEAISIARVTEYIRAQNSAGERAYPTIEPIEIPINVPTLPPLPPPVPPEPAALPRNVGQMGHSIQTDRAVSATHKITIQPTQPNDGILVLAAAPSNPLAGDPIGVPVSCTDTADNDYILFHTSKFEASPPGVNQGATIRLFFCPSSKRILIADTDIITVNWDNSVYDRLIFAWLVRHDGGAKVPTVLNKTADNDTTVYAGNKITVASPDWTPTRDNGLQFAVLLSYRAVGINTAFGGVVGWNGFYEATRFGAGGSKQGMDLHQQTYGADVFIHATGSVQDEIDLGKLPGGVLVPGFNGCGQQYYDTSTGLPPQNNTWKGGILLGID